MPGAPFVASRPHKTLQLRSAPLRGPSGRCSLPGASHGGGLWHAAARRGVQRSEGGGRCGRGFGTDGVATAISAVLEEISHVLVDTCNRSQLLLWV